MKNGDLTFSDSPMFGRVMADVEICKGVIEAVLGVSLERIEYVNAEHAIDPVLGGRGVRMDAYVRAGKGVYDVEMQTYRRKNLGKRLRYYQASMDVRALEKGKPYDFLPESYIVFLCDFDPFAIARPAYTFEVTCREDAGLDLGHGFHWLVLNAAAWRELPSGPLRSLLQYVATGERGDDRLVQKIDRAVRVANDDAVWKEKAMQILTYEEDLAMQKDMILREGRAEGIALGREEGLARGREEGLALGKEEGRAQGLAEGREAGLAEGLAEGREEGRAEGREEGRAEGLAEGRDSERLRFGTLVQHLLSADRQDDVLRATGDGAYLEQLYREFDL